MRLVASVTLCCVALLGATVAGARVPKPALGIEWSYPRSRLVQVDPTTLRRVGSTSLALGKFTQGLAFSPGKTRAAAHRYERPAVRFLDLERWAALGDVAIADEGVIDELEWLGSDRLLAVVRDDAATTIAEIDANGRTITSRLRFRGREVSYFRHAGARLLALDGPMRRIGHARLLVFAGNGELRFVRLARIAKGTVYRGRNTVSRAQPGLAVDDSGKTAFVVGTGGRIAEVDLEALTVNYHEVRTTASRAKGGEGSSWQARWEAGMLVVSGYQGPRFAGNGLRFIDTKTWVGRMIDARMGSFSIADGLVLGLSGTALVAYRLADGTLSWRHDERDISGAYTVTRPYVYLDRNDRRTAVIQLQTGSVIRRVSFADRSIIGDRDTW